MMDDFKNKHYFEDLGDQLACYITKDSGFWSMYQRNYFPPKDMPAAGVGKGNWSFVYEEDNDPHYVEGATIIRVDKGNFDNIKAIVKAFQNGLIEEGWENVASIQLEETDEGPLYIYVKPFDADPLWTVINPDYRGWAVPDLKACLRDFAFGFFEKNAAELKSLKGAELFAFIKDGVKKEFPKLSKENVEYTIRQVEDYLEGEEDYETDGTKEDLDNFLYDTDWSTLPKNATTKYISEIIKKEFPDIDAVDLKHAVAFVKETLADVYYEESYREEDKMYNILEEAFKDLNRKHTRRADEGTEVCPDCGKEVCECAKKVNELLQFDRAFQSNWKKLLNKLDELGVKYTEGNAAWNPEIIELIKIDGEDAFAYTADGICYGEELQYWNKRFNAMNLIKALHDEDNSNRYPSLNTLFNENSEKFLNEDIQVTSEEIKDFIAKVGAEAIKKALDDFENNTVETVVEEPVEDVLTADLTADDLAAEEPAEETKEDNNEEEIAESLNEDIHDLDLTGVPITFIPESEIKTFADNYSANLPAHKRPPRFFKLGYARQMVKEVAAQYKASRSGRTANKFPDAPIVNIIKCTEYSAVYSGNPWQDTDDTKNTDKVLGTARHTGEKTGFAYDGEGNIVNLIGSYPDGSKALQIYIADHSRQRVKYFISVNGEEFRLADKEEVANYLTPGEASKVLSGREAKPAGFDVEGKALFDKPINRVKLNGVYMLGNLGHSIF